jgi:regulator of chromosome condensation
MFPFFHTKGIIQVCSLSIANAALSVDGSVYTWGCEENNALGRDNLVLQGNVVIPGEVTGFVSKTDGMIEDGTIVQIAAGEQAIYYLSKRGNLYMSGTYACHKEGMFGEPIDMDGNVLGTTPSPAHVRTPLRVERVVSSPCSNFAVAILSNHSIVTWGFGEGGELGRSRDMTERDQYGTCILGRDFYLRQ